MGLDIWFKDDIANLLEAVNEANLSAMATGEEFYAGFDSACERDAELWQAYRRGFVAALATLAVALGLPPPRREAASLIGGTRVRGTSREVRARALPQPLKGGRTWER